MERCQVSIISQIKINIVLLGLILDLGYVMALGHVHNNMIIGHVAMCAMKPVDQTLITTI